MNSKFEIKIFGDIKIRTKWDPEIEDHYFSVVDVIEVLSESKNPNRYWSDLKRKLKKEGSEILNEVENMKMLSPITNFIEQMSLPPNLFFELFNQYLLQMQNHSNYGWPN